MRQEIFNQQRMNRCSSIQRSIMDNWQKKNSFEYVVRTTTAVDGMSLDDLRKCYFAVGFSVESLVEVPFTDLLVIFSMINQEAEALKKRKGKKDKKFTINYKISTAFTDEEAARLLSGIHISTPQDKGKCLKIAAIHKPSDKRDEQHEV